MTNSTKDDPAGPRARILSRGFSGLPFWLLLITAAGLRAQATTVAIDHEVKIQYDLAGEQLPVWSGGSLLTFVSNQTPAPAILAFDDKGAQRLPWVITIPESETVDLRDVASGRDGTIVACGLAYDHAGKGSRFLAILTPNGGKATVVRLSPYVAERVTVASDGTVWTAGLEITNAMDSTPPASGVIRHFDRTGKMIAGFIPRSSFSSPFMVQYGMLRSAQGRIGWYTGPNTGPGSQYYEILADGAVRKYPMIPLGNTARVNGLALTDDGRTYVTMRDQANHIRQCLFTAGPHQKWTSLPLPGPLSKAFLYGAEGVELVFSRDRFTFTFGNVSN